MERDAGLIKAMFNIAEIVHEVCPPHLQKELDTIIADLYAAYHEARTDDDPTPWCNACGAMKREQCDCGPLADND